jgi:hypothetical protein
MEIGLSIGGPEVGMPASRTVKDVPSVRMWHKCFPKACIHGVDISDCSRFQTDGSTFTERIAGTPTAYGT